MNSSPIALAYGIAYGARNLVPILQSDLKSSKSVCSLVQPISSTQCFFFSDEAHFWLNGYVNKQNCRIWSEANPQVYVETPLHPEKLTVWCALWAGGILLQKR
ncbi:hypothetical protein TNCV_2189411 [Trichonephila clavipes]|nr:hypothetical protein TNCV_2189411 [Trichonephila clavipes]